MDTYFCVFHQLVWREIQVRCNFKAELELQELCDGDVVMGRHLRVVDVRGP